jgi:aspartate/methionine/tyrosine aminotransferase
MLLRTYYILGDISSFGYESSYEFSKALINEAGVAVVPGIAFFGSSDLRERTVRFTFSKDDHILEEGGRQLVNWAQKQSRTKK